MRKLKPRDFINEFYPGSGITPTTVISWIRKGLIKGEVTPTNRFLVHVEPVDINEEKYDLINFLES